MAGTIPNNKTVVPHLEWVKKAYISLNNPKSSIDPKDVCVSIQVIISRDIVEYGHNLGLVLTGLRINFIPN